MKKPIIGIIMGSDSDLPVMKEAAAVLDDFDIPYEITVVSAHRTPERMVEYAKAAVGKKLSIIIAGAGGSAHLPGMTAALTPLPVIGVPIKTKNLDGVDSLLSIAQMPPGIPVATVAINGAKNAALLAVSILGIADENLLKKVITYKEKMRDIVLKKAQELEQKGVKAYGGELIE